MKKGFTLIELSIVLVIIGLIVGGVLVGQDLIATASIRAQISQIEKYQTAVNTFRSKYGGLPGDMPDPAATQYGLAPRPAPASCWLPGCEGQGNGDGVIEGSFASIPDSSYRGDLQDAGETIAFWTDLSAAGLIDGRFAGSESGGIGNLSLTTAPLISTYFPQARIGQGNFVYVWSGGPATANNLGGGLTPDGVNYFGISALEYAGCCSTSSSTALTVLQAYNIDRKIDDGLPQIGRVLAVHVGYNNGPNSPGVWWAAGGYNPPVTLPGHVGAADTSATSPQSYTCYDNGGSAGTQHYSIEQDGGRDLSCALSFRFQ